MTIFNLAVAEDRGTVNIHRIQSVLKGDGWARYAPNCWLVQTDRTAKKLADDVRAVAGVNASILVIEVNLQHRSGWLQQEIWDWLSKKT